MEPIKIEHDGIKKAIQSGHSYIQVGKKKFLLIEVEDVGNDDYYEVTDPEEEKQLRVSLNENNPLLSDEEINSML
ncbi:hypothetical protein LC087_11765 [Bacillus carboniphilus]|uniref:Uncharacterized protein n=1 Tax=Bacillus carboniphilus TaxID=86663 RepID=A0ABY9JQG1_9BACI|nr:hypothetical protein [Bacillus carboniphilus]WLR41562.1 hypothetical protein LC087_11765 [Bacillus carboniphilus]